VEASATSSTNRKPATWICSQDTGEYRIHCDLGSVTTLKNWLSFHVTLSDRFLSNPLPGFHRNHLLLVTGVRVSFGQ
jgi:hypothetical protein